MYMRLKYVHVIITILTNNVHNYSFIHSLKQIDSTSNFHNYSTKIISLVLFFNKKSTSLLA